MTILGKFALNITNIPTEEKEEKEGEGEEKEKTKSADHKTVEKFSQCFFEVIRQLVPTVSLYKYFQNLFTYLL